ncbi:hypothetical protein [Streptomyces lavendofoliae]|uniref:Helix-turn-helix DNA binding domain protein n=1 Tax=Streptomyces lavendofoliae TaxID=67314 RepID=A0A918M5V6_9ACTN|nr:hypothetical protein [Streptomyces lavendofoliae]GGU52228.1 hypothetical protein GCM10010274_46420 [Streptomyces lavendofoliae]
MTTADHREAPHHRNLTCVKEYRCRLPECVARHNAYQRRVYRQKGYGTWQPLVDAAPVRQHINNLRAAGHSIPEIQKQAGVGAATLARVLYDGTNKRAERIRPEVAERILAVPLTPAPVKPSTIIDATGTRRRLQALVSMGWTLTALGPRLGFHPRQLTGLLYGDRVLASTARRVADGYRVVQTLDPVAHGVPQRSATLSRNLAARQGWHGPLAWDDIDNPAAEPEVLEPYAPPAANGRDSMRIPEIRHLLGLGESPASIARQMGGNEKYIRDLITQNGLSRAA